MSIGEITIRRMYPDDPASSLVVEAGAQKVMHEDLLEALNELQDRLVRDRCAQVEALQKQIRAIKKDL